MPDETGSSAAFEEVLQLGVDTDLFAQQMQTVVDIYTRAVESMPDLDKVSGVAFSESINKLNEVISSLATNAGEALGDLSASITESAGVIEGKLNEIAEGFEKVQKARQETNSGGSFFESLTSDIASSAGALLKTMVIWNALNEIIKTTGEVIMAPFKAVADGFTYLQGAQERGSQIQAALLQSVTYSKDWGENVRIAGEQADSLVKKVDDLATKLKVSSQAVQTGFTSFLEYGGRNLTGSVDDALKVSGLVTGALQTQTPQLESRKIMSEMQKLVQGAATDSDKLAAALGLSKDQLREIVVHAQKYHDLYQEILAYAPGINERLGEANDRQSTLTATLELYASRWEGLIAGPLFKQFTAILQEILGWVDANSDKLYNLGVNLGANIGKAADAAERFLKGNWSGLVGSLTSVAGMFLIMATTIADIGLHITSIIGEYNAWSDKFNNSQNATGNRNAGRLAGAANFLIPEGMGLDGVKQSLSGSQGYYNDRAKGQDAKSAQAGQLLSNEAAAEKKMDAILDKMMGGFQKLASGDTSVFSSLLQGPGAPGYSAEAPNTAANTDHIKQVKPKFDNSGLKVDQEELRKEIEETKTAYQDEYAQIDQAVAKNLINKTDAANQIRGLNQQELLEMNQIIDAQEKKARSSGANPKMIDAAVAQMEQMRLVLKQQADKKDQVADRAADAEDEAALKAHLAAMNALEVENAKERLTLLKQAAADGYATQTQVFDAETGVMEQEYGIRRALDQEEIERAGQNKVQREQALKAIDLLDAQNTSNMQLRTEQRIALIEKEAQARFAYQQEMEKLNAEELKTSRSLTDDTPAKQIATQRELAAIQATLTEQAIKNTAALLAEAQARNADSDATRKYTELLQTLENQRLNQFVDQVRTAGATQGNNPALAQAAMKSSADAQIKALQNSIDGLNKTLEAEEAKLQQGAATGNLAAVGSAQSSINGTTAQITAATDSLKAMQDASNNLGNSFEKVGQKLEQSLLGPNFDAQWQQSTKDWGDATTATQSATAGFEVAGTAIGGLANAANTVMGVINQYEQGRKQGGVLGGVGSLLSSGPVSDALSMIPIVGSMVKPLGEAFSFIGDMFTAQAKKIADNINKASQAIEQQYSLGAITLQQTIQELQQQRQDAITQLSGEKGGKDQLNKLLPGLDQEIAQLQKQQTDLLTTFEQSLQVLQSGGTELQNWTKTWMDINKQVKDYLDAGGSILKANQYLNDELAAQRQAITDNLVSGEQQAISDAISLNNLLEQRIELQQQEAEAEFNLQTQGAIEKRVSSGVATATELQQQRAQYNQQMNDLQNQINIGQAKVDLEKQVFQIASDTGTLQTQQNYLTLVSLREQLATYQQMAALIQSTNGLSFTGTAFSGTGTIPGSSVSDASAAAAAPINLTVNVDATGQDVNGAQFGNYLATAITSKLQSGRTYF